MPKQFDWKEFNNLADEYINMNNLQNKELVLADIIMDLFVHQEI